jgi:hypothetical protein
VGTNGSITAAGANNVFAVGSTSNILVGYELWIDEEAMLVTAIPASGQVAVQRGYDQTNVASHAAGALIVIGTVSGTIGSPFQSNDPSLGTCTLSNEIFTFRVNTNTGRNWICTSNGWRSSLGPTSAGMVPVYSGQTAGTTTTTLLPQYAGSTFYFDAATGNNYVLPAPVVGMTFDFIQTVTVTSNSSEVQTNASTVFLQGSIQISGVATTFSYACNGTSHIAIKQNGSTTGGVLGGRLHFVAVSATKWQVDGLTNGSGTGATPCSTTT